MTTEAWAAISALGVPALGLLGVWLRSHLARKTREHEAHLAQLADERTSRALQRQQLDRLAVLHEATNQRLGELHTDLVAVAERCGRLEGRVQSIEAYHGLNGSTDV